MKWWIAALPIIVFAVVLAIPLIAIAWYVSRKDDRPRGGYSRWIE